VRGHHQIRVIRAPLTVRTLPCYREDRVAGDRASGGSPRRTSEDGSGNSRLIGRGDLLAALDRAAAKKVTIISAPAGSGKTSLLSAWADRPGQPYRLAVMQVQRDQHDAQQFWLALLTAVRQASATASRAEPPAATPGFNGRAMVDRVLAEFADARDGVSWWLMICTSCTRRRPSPCSPGC